ncbi:MAG: pre-peptidase C-terminal domain-containing protein [Bacteroidota bacterium]
MKSLKTQQILTPLLFVKKLYYNNKLSASAKFTLTAIILLIGNLTQAQISKGGLPKSFELGLSDQAIHEIKTPPVNINQLLEEDRERRLDNLPYRFAKPFNVNLNLSNAGQWTNLPDGGRIWRLQVSCRKAVSVNFLYDDFYIPEGGSFFIYTPDRQTILGGFGAHNNRASRKFATSMVKSTSVILEYYEPAYAIGQGAISVGQVSHGYRNLSAVFGLSKEDLAEDLGSAGDCQVNINCSEGNDWQVEKKSVAMIVLDGFAICTGTLINTTAEGCQPYFLTANHCLDSDYDAITNPDASDMVFYWNYERPECNNNGIVPIQTTVGATVIANSGGSAASESSDFALLELIENPADVYDVHFAGWDASGDTGTSGIGIHHPGGDAKKIATHSSIPQSVVSNQYWRIYWDATANGHSVTEGGSSGSALFNSNGQIIGQLYGGFDGGQPNCSDPNADEGDYGKLSYSWENAGATDKRRRLKDLLDPIGGGSITSVQGSRPQTCVAVGNCSIPAFAACGAYEGNIAEGANNHSQHNGDDWMGNEYIYQITPSYSGEMIFTLLNLSEADFGLFLSSSCSPKTTISQGNAKAGGEDEQMSYNVLAGTTYYLIIDAKVATSGAYELLLDCPALPAPCELPEIINCGETIASSNIGTDSEFDNYVGSPYSYTGPEKVFSVNAAVGNLQITVSWADRRNDLDLFLFDVCDANASYLATSAGSSNTESINYNISTAGIYYIIVDGYEGAQSDFDITVNCSSVVVSPKIMLEGTWNDNQAEMRIAENNSELIPLEEPYTDLGYNYVGGGGETTHSSVIATKPIIGWAIVELRDANDPTLVRSSCAALVDKDGNVVESKDGSSPVSFAIASGSYYLAIRFRSHVPVMTASPIAL